MPETDYSPGLEGVAAGKTAISEIDEARASLTYRGYDIRELAKLSTYEETAFLLLHGRLPGKAELDGFDVALRGERGLPDEVMEILRSLPRKTHSMDMLRTGISALSAFDPDGWDNSPEAGLRKAVRIIAKMPTLVAAGYRIAHRMEPVPPEKGLSAAANFLHMLHARPPEGPMARIFDTSLIIYAEHEYNASSFSARVTVSTLSDIYSGITSAVGTLKGPLHGGANEEVMKMLIEVGRPERADEWVKDALARKKRIMGFGHRVYKHGDTRAPILKEASAEICDFEGYCRWHDISLKVEEAVKRETGLLPNVDYFSATVYYLLGLPLETFTPIFAMARSAGWCSHVIEQLGDNRLIRPRSIYTGARGLKYVSIDKR